MKIHELGHGILYIEDAFPKAKEFVDAMEDPSNVNRVIPDWEKWVDKGYDGKKYVATRQGSLKQINWDYSINKNNTMWPRKEVIATHSQDHEQADKILNMIHEPLLEALEVWYEKTGNEKFDWISKNYIIKKYDTGKQIPSHADRNDDKFHTFDWTALIYLNDDYTGGELYFDDLDITLSPSAGSIIFFSTDEIHTAREVLTGHKYFMFFYIHTQFKIMHSIKENTAHIVNLFLTGKKD
jgi:hypothetical protein